MLSRLTSAQEMRRRAWALVRMADITFSHQVRVTQALINITSDHA